MTPGVLHPEGPGSLRGDSAVVTGGARGIGSHVAVELARAGAAVTVLDVLDATDTVEQITSEGGSAAGVRVDVTDRAAVAAAVAGAGGDVDLDILVTAAGVYGDSPTLDELTEAELDKVLSVNLAGTLWCVQAALPLLRAGDGGRVVCIGSVAGKIGGVLAGPHYAASKGGVHAVVRWLARTQASAGVTANGIAPGAVDTDMIVGRGYEPDYCPLGRLASPQEIAGVAAFLASPAAGYMTGTVIDVNGGYFMG